MVSLFGKKDDSEQNGENGDMARNSQDSSSRREPNERDRLLPESHRPPPRHDGYLDPDDPAVSPYNLWTVRFARYLTVLFLAISFVWWVLLFVSIFVSPPGLHTRGSGFFDFAYTTLTTGILMLSLLFFSNPSLAMRICQAIMAVLLLVDLAIIAAVPRLRVEEGPPGIASVGWTTLMALWCIVIDRLVAYGKREEEERLTGRAEHRRTLKQWTAILVTLIFLIVYIVIVVLMTGTLILRWRDSTLATSGTRYWVDDHKYKVHLSCVGNASEDENGNRKPAVLLEAAEEPSEFDFEHWAYNAYQNGTIDKYCYWDRPGYAWSDNAPSPHSAGMSASVLREALARAGEEGPWILVSAGYGSIVSRIFASIQHTSEVVGIMMVDPLNEDLLYKVSSPTRGFIIWGYGVISPLGLQRLFGALFKGRSRQDRVYGKSAYQGGKFIKAQLQENLVAQSLTKSEIANARTVQTPETPLVVISSGIEVKKNSDWEKKQEDLTKITDNLISWDVVNQAPHFVWSTYDGRKIMEKRLGQLVKQAMNKTITD